MQFDCFKEEWSIPLLLAEAVLRRVFADRRMLSEIHARKNLRVNEVLLVGKLRSIQFETFVRSSYIEEEAQIFQPSSSFQLLSQTPANTYEKNNSGNTRVVVLSVLASFGSSRRC